MRTIGCPPRSTEWLLVLEIVHHIRPHSVLHSLQQSAPLMRQMMLKDQHSSSHRPHRQPLDWSLLSCTVQMLAVRHCLSGEGGLAPISQGNITKIEMNSDIGAMGVVRTDIDAVVVGLEVLSRMVFKEPQSFIEASNGASKPFRRNIVFDSLINEVCHCFIV